MEKPSTRKHWYPRSNPNEQPSPWWYYGRALYVSRRDYFKIYCALMIALGIPFTFLAFHYDSPLWKFAALQGGVISLFYLGYSIFAMYRMYGPPSRQYVQRLIKESGTQDAKVVADLHIGTYRHSYLMADLLPQAQVHSIDCWGVDGDPHEIAIRDVRDLESQPTHHQRILPKRAEKYRLPMPDASCDAVLFGFGTHEVPNDGSRASLFAEAKRTLKPGGKALMFEHGNDFHNVLVFGPVISHVVTRTEWMEEFKNHFAANGYARTSHAVDLFWGEKAEPVGSVAKALTPEKSRFMSLGTWTVVAAFTLVSLAVVTFLPQSQLLAIYWGIAISGLTWPWLGIVVALLSDGATCRTSNIGWARVTK